MSLITCVTPTNGQFKDVTDATSYTTGNITIVSGKLYLATVFNTGASGNAILPTMSTTASGVTFAQVGTQTSVLTTIRTTVFRFMVTTDTSGTITASYGATTQTGAIIFISEVSNVEAGANGAYAVRNYVGTSGSTSITSINTTLGAFGKTQNGTFAAMAKQNGENVTVTGVTELLDDNIATPVRSLTTGFQNSNVTTPNFAWTTANANWNIQAFELIASSYPKVMIV